MKRLLCLNYLGKSVERPLKGAMGRPATLSHGNKGEPLTVLYQLHRHNRGGWTREADRFGWAALRGDAGLSPVSLP